MSKRQAHSFNENEQCIHCGRFCTSLDIGAFWCDPLDIKCFKGLCTHEGYCPMREKNIKALAAWPVKLENISYPLMSVYAAKNVHGYAAYSTNRLICLYDLNPWGPKVVRMGKGWWDGIEQGLIGAECHVCGGNTENADHQFTLVRLTNDEGLLLNEDGTLLLLTHDRPNTVGTITGIKED